MKSISKFVVAAAALLFAHAASAGTLYWQVNDGAPDIGAELWMDDGKGHTTSLSDGLIDAPTGIQQADLTSYGDLSSYSFYVELYNYTTGNSTIGHRWSYTELLDSGYVAFDGRDMPTAYANAAAHSNFAVAPEPSSGLLLLIGGSLLALRRRRRS